MTPRKPLILLKKSGASSFQHVSRQTTKSRPFGVPKGGWRGEKPSKFLHLEGAANCPCETPHETLQLLPEPDPDQQREAALSPLQAH